MSLHKSLAGFISCLLSILFTKRYYSRRKISDTCGVMSFRFFSFQKEFLFTLSSQWPYKFSQLMSKFCLREYFYGSQLNFGSLLFPFFSFLFPVKFYCFGLDYCCFINFIRTRLSNRIPKNTLATMFVENIYSSCYLFW